MVAASRIVCALAAFCGAAHAAPMTVTYDQRQNGEFNLQVDADGIAVVLMPGDFFERKYNGLLAHGGGEKLQQIFGRHSVGGGDGGHKGDFLLRKKKKKNCTSTAQPEKPYTESPVTLPASASTYAPEPAASSLPESAASYIPESPTSSLHELPASSPLEAPESFVPVQSQGNVVEENSVAPENVDVRLSTDQSIRPGVSAEDPYSVTPNTPDIVRRPETVEGVNHEGEAPEATDSAVETMAVEENSAVATAPKTEGAVEIVVKSSTETNFEEKPVSVSSSDAKVVEKSTTNDDKSSVKDGVSTTHEKPAIVPITVAETQADAQTQTDVKPLADAKPQVDVKPLSDVKPLADAKPQGDVKPLADAKPMADAKPLVDTKPLQVDAKLQVDKTVQGDHSGGESSEKTSKVDTKKTDEPIAMVAMKTMEKPTFSEALKVVKKQPSEGFKNEKPASEMVAMKTVENPTFSEVLKVTKKQPSDVPVEKPTEMVAMKTIEKPSVDATADKSEVVKPVVEVHTAEVPVKSDGLAAEEIVSRSAPKPTEMVAVKTMENPGATTVTTAGKSVVSVKTVMRAGQAAPKTAVDGTSFMRKVGDRKPPPSITLEVTRPKVVA